MAGSPGITCLTRCKTARKRRYALIPLVEGKEVSMGRGLDVSVQLLSKKRDSLILLSRKHAVFKENGAGKWTVTDNKSLNGVYLNDVRLKPATPFPIEEGDIIQIGAVPETEAEAEFVFQVVKKDLSVAKAEEILVSLNPSNVAKRKDSQQTELSKVKSEHEVLSNGPKRKRVEDQSSVSHGVGHRYEFGEPSSSHAASKRTRVDDQKHKNVGLSDEAGQVLNAILRNKGKHSYQEILQMIQSKSLSPHKKKEEDELKSKLEEQERLLKEKEEEMRRITDDLKAKAQEKENCLLEQLEKQKEELLSEKMKVEKEMKEMAENLEAKAQQKELTLMEQLAKQREELLAERQCVEKTLQENLAKQLAEKDENFNKEQEKLRKELEERIKKKDDEMLAEIEAQKSALLVEKQKVEESLQSEVAKNLEQKKLLEEEKKRLEGVITNKEQEYTSMQEKLEEGQKARKEEEELKIAKAKQEAFDNITDVLESELQCSICAELFIQATTLNCSHSFCNYCITQWMKRKKECPVCRAPIKSHSLSIVLDNYIDKMVESLGDDVKQRRKEMLEDRKKTEGDGKGDVPDAAVVISDGDDDEDEDVDDISSESNEDEDSTYDDDGVPGAYYGGYGRCYNCDEQIDSITEEVKQLDHSVFGMTYERNESKTEHTAVAGKLTTTDETFATTESNGNGITLVSTRKMCTKRTTQDDKTIKISYEEIESVTNGLSTLGRESNLYSFESEDLYQSDTFTRSTNRDDTYLGKRVCPMEDGDDVIGGGELHRYLQHLFSCLLPLSVVNVHDQ